MEPRIQYAKTSDGVSIAYAVAGDGPPLVRVPMPSLCHAQRDWDMFPNLWAPLAQVFRLVLYDARASGLSDREAIDFSMEAMARDFEAVIDRAGLQSAALLAFWDGVPIAVTCAAAFPSRVTHLILVDGYTSAADFADSAAYAVDRALIDKDWTLYTETVMRVLMGFSDPRLVEHLGQHMRACIEPEAYRALADAELAWDDPAPLLPKITAPTLVLHNNGNTYVPVRVGQRIAASIPDARFLAIDDPGYDRLAALVQEFAAAGAGKDRQVVGGLVTILFTDIEGSTALTQRLGDEKAREVLREHERITRECLRAHGGSEVKTMGDGFMASFASATKALECAIAIQRAFEERNAGVRAHHDAPLRVRIGLNAGEPIAEESDLFGTAVITAARIAAQAQGGEVLVSNVVRELVAGKGFLFSDRGESALRGFEDPVRLYEVRWQA